MKVLHVIPSIDLTQGGPSIAIRTITRGLAQAGLDVHIAATSDKGEKKLEEGVTRWCFPRQTQFYMFSWPLTRWLAQRLKDFDLVHIHGLFSYATIPAAYWAGRNGIPYIIRPFGTLNRWGLRNRRRWLKGLSLRLIENRILSGAARIHFTSEQERLEAEESGVTGKSVIIPEAVEPLLPSPVPLAGRFRLEFPQLEGRKIFLFLSRIDPKKGLDLLLSAFARIKNKNPNVALVVAGTGKPSFVAHLQAEALRLGVGRDILWSGFLESREKWASLADADIFVLPSYSENFGIAVTEAMVSGLPVIISDQVGIHPDVSEGEAGIVVKTNVEQLAGAMKKLLENPERGKRMGENGKRLVREKFSVDKVIPQIVKLYEETLRDSHRN